jgi:hypothetical protein
MGGLRYCYALIRRSLGHASELFFLAWVFDDSPLWHLLYKAIVTRPVGYVLIVMALNCLYELLLISLRPDLGALSAACNEDSPMLPFPKDRK